MKVVIIKLGALGDIIMSTPIIKSLLNEHKNDEVYVFTSPAYAPIFRAWRGLSVKQFPRKGLVASVKSILWLRSSGFDRVYDLQSNDRSRILCASSGIRQKIGNHKCFPYTHHPGDRYYGQNHIFDRYNQLLACVGIKAAEAKPWIPVPEAAHERVDRWLQEHSLASRRGKLVLLHAGASHLHPQKRWPHYADLARMLTAAGYDVVWLGAGADAKLNARLANITGIDASDAFTVFELVALGQRAKFAVTNDSGPMHVLACAGLPVYALFGPTDWERQHAIGQRERVVSLRKSNPVWAADDYLDSDVTNLGLISAAMLWSVLLKANQIVQ